MKKNNLRAIVAAAIILVLYNLVVFLIPFPKTPVFWISWVATLVALFVAGTSVYFALCKNPDAKSRFYGFPLARIGVVYCVAQILAGFVCMALGCFIPWWVALLLYAIGLGVTLIGLISAEAAVEEIQAQDVKLKAEVTLMRSLQSKINQIAAQFENAEIKALAEELRYSDPVSSDAIAEAEAELSAVIDMLQGAYVDGDNAAVSQLCRRASALLAERNRLCKLNKN